MIKNMNSKMTTNSQLSTNETKRKITKTKTKQLLEQEQKQRNGHHMEGFQRGGGSEEWGEGTGKKKHGQQA